MNLKREKEEEEETKTVIFCLVFDNSLRQAAKFPFNLGSVFEQNKWLII